jgi:hypothetical protein
MIVGVFGEQNNSNGGLAVFFYCHNIPSPVSLWKKHGNGYNRRVKVLSITIWQPLLLRQIHKLGLGALLALILLGTSGVTCGAVEPPNPIDLTPVTLPERGGGAFGSFRTNALYSLPGRMFFNATVENSGRLETNVFQTASNNKPDFVYRILPNVSLGYALTRTSRVSANYFTFQDVYTVHGNPLTRNTQSVGFQIDKDWNFTPRTTLTTTFFARELFITGQQALSDLLPQAILTHRVGQRGVLYSSIIGQIRYRKMLARYQEFDQFYTVGGVWQNNPWTLIADTTFITNFGKQELRGGNNNQLFIITLEAGRRIPKVPLPLTAFIRAQPIFNMGANSSPGFAGFNMRLFGGIRAEIAKPAIFPVGLKKS